MFKSHLKRFLTETPRSVSRLSANLLISTGITQGYQPLSSKCKGMRACAERFEAIRENIAGGSLCLDVGCNTGYFAHEMARMGIFTIGLESEMKNVIVADARYSAPNLLFKHFSLDSDTAMSLPEADIILFLSVFHHLVKSEGRDGAIEVLRTLAEKCSRQLYFETGQPEERGARWSGLMEFMGDTGEWTEKFFTRRCGFREVRCLGSFETFLTPVKRNLFLAVR